MSTHHHTRRKSTLVRAVASEQLADVVKVPVVLRNHKMFINWFRIPQLQPEVRDWLHQYAGKGTIKRPAFDAHAKFRWYYFPTFPPRDNTQPMSWQERSDWERKNEQVEFWFKDQAAAMLFKLTWGGT